VNNITLSHQFRFEPKNLSSTFLNLTNTTATGAGAGGIDDEA